MASYPVQAMESDSVHTHMDSPATFYYGPFTESVEMSASSIKYQ